LSSNHEVYFPTAEISGFATASINAILFYSCTEYITEEDILHMLNLLEKTSKFHFISMVTKFQTGAMFQCPKIISHHDLSPHQISLAYRQWFTT